MSCKFRISWDYFTLLKSDWVSSAPQAVLARKLSLIDVNIGREESSEVTTALDNLGDRSDGFSCVGLQAVHNTFSDLVRNKSSDGNPNECGVVHFNDPVVDIRAFRAIVLSKLIINILLIVADSSDQVKAREWLPHRNNFFLLLNLLTIFIDRLLAVCTKISLPLGVGIAVDWVLEQVVCSSLSLVVRLKQLNNMSQLLTAHDVIGIETVVPRARIFFLERKIEIQHKTPCLGFGRADHLLKHVANFFFTGSTSSFEFVEHTFFKRL